MKSIETTKQIAKYFGLEYIDLEILLSMEKSKRQNQFSGRKKLESKEIFHILKRSINREKTQINGFCFNLDFADSPKMIQQVSSLNLGDTKVIRN